MILDDQKILKNTKKYFTTAQEKGFMTPELLEFLGQEFIEAPLSARKEFNNAFKGGLIAHLLLVTKYAVSFNEALPEEEKVNKDSLIKICLLHKIGMAKIYKIQTNQWHIDKGMFYDFNDMDIAMRVTERSVFYANNYGVKFTEEETSAILMSDKSNDKMTDYHNSTLGELLKSGIAFATKNELKNNV